MLYRLFVRFVTPCICVGAAVVRVPEAATESDSFPFCRTSVCGDGSVANERRIEERDLMPLGPGYETYAGTTTLYLSTGRSFLTPHSFHEPS